MAARIDIDARRHSQSKSNKRVSSYYDKAQWYYSRFWSPHALHYGLWQSNTENLEEALRNTDRYVCEQLAVGSGDIVLDAGCGVGGSSLYIAESTGARVVGITISAVQCAIARRLFAKSPAADRLTVSFQDYTATGFVNNAFSKVFAIESLCHAPRKEVFLREAYRVLQPGGKLLVIDAFLARQPLKSEERRAYRAFKNGWAVPRLACRSGFETALLDVGFNDVVFTNLQAQIGNSIQRIFLQSVLLAPVKFIRHCLGIGKVNLAAWYQRVIFESGLTIYGSFLATK